MIGWGGTRISGTSRLTGIGPRWLTSAPVTTATTPGARRARSRSIRVMRAWAWGDRSRTTWTHRSEEHTSELQSRLHLVCRLLLEKKKKDRRQLITRR